MSIFGQMEEIHAVVASVIKASKSALIQRARNAGGISEEGYHFAVHAKALTRHGIDPAKVTEELAAVVKETTGVETHIEYHQRRLFSRKPNTAGNATVGYAMDEERIHTHFAASSHPPAKTYITQRERAAREAAAHAAEWHARDAIRQAEFAAEVEASRVRAEINARYKGSPLTVDSLNPDALCVTHATRYLPVRNPDGSVEITTLSMVTNNEQPRNSVHFALNHKVSSHMYGSWDDAGITVIAPFNAVHKLNGVPAGLNTVDTYWTCGLGKRLRVPEATLVVPGDVKKGLYELSLTETHYKTSGFSDADIAAIRSGLSEFERSGFDKQLEALAADHEQKEKFLASHVNQIAIDETMRYLGYKVQNGGMWAWDGSHEVTRKTAKLADALDTSCWHHGSSPHGILEEDARRILSRKAFLEKVIENGELPRYEASDRCYFTPGHMAGVEADEYHALLEPNPFGHIVARMQKSLSRVDAVTQEVYADWLARLEPVTKKIADALAPLKEKETLRWREQMKSGSPAASSWINSL